MSLSALVHSARCVGPGCSSPSALPRDRFAGANGRASVIVRLLEFDPDDLASGCLMMADT